MNLLIRKSHMLRAAVCVVMVLVGGCASPTVKAAGRTDDQIQEVFARHKNELYSIYSEALANKPTLRGTMVMRLTVSDSGEIIEGTIVSSTLKDAEFEESFLARVRALEFGAIVGGRTTFLYPVTFQRN